ncbi:MAG: asparagine synthase (glutamine-hydrolyzing) [Verrucomicrobia bacterium]|nr:asparagine synthase (glutamine-hydrolyzing) [Verrucomicrobiota bacterium]
MCGIAGIWNFDGQPIGAVSIDRFTDSLAHRGPDGRGIWRDDAVGIAFGHRRLSILDLSEAGKQPMSYANGRYWITYNGEIYNFLELRQELEQQGFEFRTQTDTEVILAAYLKWGPDALLRFNGMWAFAIFDRQERRLFLARDRFGIKPLLYRLTPQRFAFASELKSFKHLEGYVPGIDLESAKVFLRDSMVLEGARRTMLDGVHRLQAGHYALIHARKLTLRRWWNTLEHLGEPAETVEEQADQFRELFYDSVRLRMRSDVSIGSCLSGGFDSSAIVCALSEIGRSQSDGRQSRDWQQTFVATFPNATNDEQPQAEEVVRFARVKGHFFPIRETDALTNLDRIFHDFDDVSLAMPTAIWMIYKELRRSSVVVSLDGHGADELMGGYKQADYFLFHNAPSLWRSPISNARLLRQYWATLRTLKLCSTGRQLAEAVVSGFLRNHPDCAGLYAKTTRIRRWLRPGFLHETGSTETEDFVGQCQRDELPKHWGPENRSLYRMFHSTILPSILRNFDRLSMAHGVEVRMPFMDWRLVSLVFSLPDCSKFKDDMTKVVARQAMKNRMPESIRTSRTKIGFNSPLPEWLNGPLQPWVRDLIESNGFRTHSIFKGQRLAKYIENHDHLKSWTWLNCGTAWRFLHYFWFERNFLKY